MPHHFRRIGHAGLAGAIFEYGRNLGTGDWSTLSHLSDMDLTVVEKLATVPLATTLAAIGGVRACALTSSGDPLDGRAHPLELGAQSRSFFFVPRARRCGHRRKFLLRINGPETPAPGRKPLTLLAAGTSPGPTTQSFEPAVFPETAKEPAIGGLLRLRFGLRGDGFWPEGDFGRSVSGPRNPVSPMQIDLG